MSDELPDESEFTDDAEGERAPLDGEATRTPKAGVALSVLWWVESEPERG